MCEFWQRDTNISSIIGIYDYCCFTAEVTEAKRVETFSSYSISNYLLKGQMGTPASLRDFSASDSNRFTASLNGLPGITKEMLL